MTADPLAEDRATKVPERVCEDRIPGGQVKPLLPARDGKLKEETLYFDRLYDQGHCILSTKNEEVLIAVESIPVYRYPRESTQRQGIPISLGPAYGYMSKEHSIQLYIPCAAKYKTQRVVVGVTATTNQPDTATAPPRAEPVEGDDKVAAFTAAVAREITRDWLKCPGADKLPDGPVKIHWP
ncbi:hypothetical protein [Streptomyces sp. NPDC057702]|uniref:hypothetical protein n=1 Tax=unclassified Streptomyces TaxID=2593676 RepID=UPI0036C2C73A